MDARHKAGHEGILGRGDPFLDPVRTRSARAAAEREFYAKSDIFFALLSNRCCEMSSLPRKMIGSPQAIGLDAGAEDIVRQQAGNWVFGFETDAQWTGLFRLAADYHEAVPAFHSFRP